MPAFDRRVFLGGLSATVVLSACAPAQADSRNWRKQGFSKLANAAENLVRDGEVTGMAVGMSTRGLRKSRYFGLSNLAKRETVSDQTKFRIASITKPLIAACTLKLEQQDILTVDQTVSHFLPDFPKGHKITLYHLLTHTSGLANWWGRLPPGTPHDFMDGPEPHRAIAAMRDPFLFEPGTQHSYSNSGYVVLGEIIERATGDTLETTLRREVLLKTGSDNIELERTGATGDNWATGYEQPGRHFAPVGVTAMPYAAGGLRSNLHDLMAVSDAIFHGKLLNQMQRARMFAHARLDDGRLVHEGLYSGPEVPPYEPIAGETEMGYGLGINTWVQHGERFYSHAGAIDGFAAYLLHAPRSLTSIVLLANTGGATGPLHQPARDMLIGGNGDAASGS